MKTNLGLLHWLPRILRILAILFISSFALDAFGSGRPVQEQLVGFLMHLIPSFVLTALLLVAWKWELVGGVLFMVIGVCLSPVVYNVNHNRNHFSGPTSLGIVMMITFPFVVVGGLFLLSHILQHKHSPALGHA